MRIAYGVWWLSSMVDLSIIWRVDYFPYSKVACCSFEKTHIVSWNCLINSGSVVEERPFLKMLELVFTSKLVLVRIFVLWSLVFLLKFRAPEISISIIQSFCLARNTAVMFSLVLLLVTWIHQLYLLLSILWIIADVWPTFALEVLLWRMLICTCWMGACRFSWAICMSFE